MMLCYNLITRIHDSTFWSIIWPKFKNVWFVLGIIAYENELKFWCLIKLIAGQRKGENNKNYLEFGGKKWLDQVIRKAYSYWTTWKIIHQVNLMTHLTLVLSLLNDHDFLSLLESKTVSLLLQERKTRPRQERKKNKRENKTERKKEEQKENPPWILLKTLSNTCIIKICLC